MCLTVLFGRRVVELKGADACSGHQQERYILDVFYLLFVGILVEDEHANMEQSVSSSYLEDIQDFKVAADYKMLATREPVGSKQTVKRDSLTER